LIGAFQGENRVKGLQKGFLAHRVRLELLSGATWPGVANAIRVGFLPYKFYFIMLLKLIS